MNQYQKLLSEIETFIRSGDFGRVKYRFEQMSIEKIPRSLKAEFSNTARRSNLIFTSLKILNPIIRSEYPLKSPASDREKIEYASSLLRIGAKSECKELLNEISSFSNGEDLFVKGLLAVSDWNYEEASDLFKSYIDLETRKYRLWVGMLNLASSYVATDKLQEVEPIIEKLERVLDIEKNKLLIGNVWEVKSQLLIKKGCFNEAINVLQNAMKLLKWTKGSSPLFVEKWKLIAQLKLNPNSKNIQNLIQFREKALYYKHWETVRDCDYYLAIVENNKTLFSKLYFGTPYKSYKNKIVKSLRGEYKLPEKFIWCKSQDPKNIIKLESGLFNEKIIFSPGRQTFNLMKILCQDYYRPIHIGHLFSKLFSEEYFNPDSSVFRISQAISRLRNLFDEYNINITISNVGRAYFLDLDEGIGIEATRELSPKSLFHHHLVNLNKKYENLTFTAKQARDHLSISKSNLGRFLKWSVENGYIKKIGSGKNTKYKKVA